ncbi:FadR/GntR family transcriptional regulator [Sciscionella marina]|uniref:FadR/GntR family transcriptional regulator n=1 Tax=Sciscionella marina TaxID=508770 RepID=UPI00036F8330|nr:FadR/GntR family transcriptional regulator [Sciscionella marina]
MTALDPLPRRILGLIQERGLRTGDPMPTELELIDQLAVSRNTVREAIRSLRALGIVEIRHGHGTFVGEASLHTLSPSLTFRALSGDIEGLRNLVEVRALIEIGTIRRLAGELEAATLDRLDELCTRMEQVELHAEADRQFHHTLYAGLDNPLIGQLVDLFWTAYLDARAGMRVPESSATDCVADNHRAILAALRTGDPEAASQAMAAHFADLQHRLTP